MGFQYCVGQLARSLARPPARKDSEQLAGKRTLKEASEQAKYGITPTLRRKRAPTQRYVDTSREKSPNSLSPVEC